MVHSRNCAWRASRLENQDASPRKEGEDSFFHASGTASAASETMSASMRVVMVRPPFSPKSSSNSPRFISTSSRFMRSDSCKPVCSPAALV